MPVTLQELRTLPAGFYGLDATRQSAGSDAESSHVPQLTAKLTQAGPHLIPLLAFADRRSGNRQQFKPR